MSAIYRRIVALPWKFKLSGGESTPVNTGSHKVYVTYGTPGGSSITEKRVAYVVDKASGLLKVKTHFLPGSKLFLDIEGLNPKNATTKQISSSATEKALFGLNVY